MAIWARGFKPGGRASDVLKQQCRMVKPPSRVVPVGSFGGLASSGPSLHPTSPLAIRPRLLAASNG